MFHVTSSITILNLKKQNIYKFKLLNLPKQPKLLNLPKQSKLLNLPKQSKLLNLPKQSKLLILI